MNMWHLREDLGSVTCCWSMLKTVLVLDDLVEDNADADQREDGRSHAHRGRHGAVARV